MRSRFEDLPAAREIWAAVLQGAVQMTLPLTSPNAELDRLVRQTPPNAMMHWSGTCADKSAACGGCRHYGYDDVIRDDAGNALTTRRHPSSCALVHSYTKRLCCLRPRLPANTMRASSRDCRTASFPESVCVAYQRRRRPLASAVWVKCLGAWSIRRCSRRC